MPFSIQSLALYAVLITCTHFLAHHFVAERLNSFSLIILKNYLWFLKAEHEQIHSRKWKIFSIKLHYIFLFLLNLEQSTLSSIFSSLWLYCPNLLSWISYKWPHMAGCLKEWWWYSWLSLPTNLQKPPLLWAWQHQGALQIKQIYLFSNCLFITFQGFVDLSLEGKGRKALNNDSCQGTDSL